MYTFSSLQLAELTSLVAKDWTAETTRAQFYSKLGEILREPDALGTDGGLDGAQLRLWLRGAEQANNDRGLFSKLIRGYTDEQAALRNVTERYSMQEASNTVADNLINDIKNRLRDGNANAPTLAEVAVNDATAIGKVVFKSVGEQDSAFKYNSAWSGTLLFSMLGGNELARLYQEGTSNSLDVVGDLKNLLYAVKSFSTAVGNGVDLVVSAYPQLSNAIAKTLFITVMTNTATAVASFISSLDANVQNDARDAWNDLLVLKDTMALWRGSAFQGTVDSIVAMLNTNNFSTFMLGLVFENTPLEPYFKIIDKLGLDQFVQSLNRLAGSTTTSTDLQATMNSITATAGYDSKIQLLTGLSMQDLLQKAQTEPSVKAALASLSLVAIDSSAYSITAERPADWWAYRAGMLSALGTSGGAGTDYLDTTTQQNVSGTAVNGAPSRVVFDASASDATWGIDILFGKSDVSNVLNGDSGPDRLYGGTLNDWLGYTAASTSAGSLTERDSDGNYYEGGTGTDHIFGSINADRIRFSQGDGTDIVTGNGGADILEYVADGAILTASREGKSLVLSRTLANGTVDRIVMQNWFADIPAESMRLDRVDFGALDPTTGLFVASGSLSGDILHEQGLHKQIGATAQELRGDLVAYQETLQGSDRSDWLYSSQAVDENSVGDILVGGVGDDYLYGSIGADKVRIGAGDGKDVFRGNGGADIVETYGGINITHTYTKLDKVGADLRATFIDGTQLTIRDWDVEGKLMAFREGRDGSLVGYDWVNQNLDNFYGDAGVNVITGNALANELYGYGGADRLVGGGGNDKFWGGTGNDELVGGTGNDTFYFGLGDGIDHIWGGGGSDVLDFQASGQGRPLTASRVGNDIKFSYSASDNVTVHDWFSTAGAAMTVKLPNGQVMSSSQVNAGFNTTALGWTGGVYNSQDFLAVLYSLNSNFKILDDQYKATWGKSFYAQAFNSMVKNYYNDTGVDINGSSVYSWGAGIGNAYATPGTILYGDVWWNFWSNGNGGHNFVITQANAGRVLNGWSYDSGNPGGLSGQSHIDKALYYQYQNPMQAIPTTRDSFVVYDGAYAQASAMGVYNVSSTSTQSFSDEEHAGGYRYSTSGSGEAAELVGISNAQMMYLA